MTEEKKLAFRMWHQSLKKMVYWDDPEITYATVADESGRKSLCFLFAFKVAKGSELFFGSYTETMQYTGLRDKNGHPIYEDDVVSFGDGMYRIVFGDACFWITQPGYSMELHTILGQGEIEVIGNVHEAPELLEVKA